MRPSVGQLEAFYWVVRLGSIKKAAEHLNLAQPTVSLRISDLEEQFGHAIFQRDHRKLTLTRHGETLLPRVTSLINELSRLRQLMAHADDVAGVVRVGLSETFAQVCLPTCMKRLHSQFPGVQLDITIGTSGALEQDVLDRQLDLAFVINPKGDPSLHLTQLGIQDAVWAAASQLGLPSIVSPSILQTTTIITTPHPSPMYRQIIDWFRADGIEPSNSCRCSSVTVATQLVRSGLGTSLLPLKLVQNDLQTGSLVELKTKRPAAPSHLYCIFRSADQNRLTKAVVAIFREVITEMNFLM